MKYFHFFPTINYQFPDGTVKNAVDFFSRPELTIDDTSGFNLSGNEYVIEDAKSPDIVSKELYGDSNYFWSILLTNDIIDFYRQWPVSYKLWENELASVNSNFTFYTIYNTEIKKGDIVVKKTLSSRLFDIENYGIVLSADKFMRSFDVLMVAGDIKENDEYYILRSNGRDYSIISPDNEVETQSLKKKIDKLSSAVNFKKLDDNTQKEVFVSPYYDISGGSLVSDQIELITSYEGRKTVLYHYMYGLLPDNIKPVEYITYKQDEWIFDKTINVLPRAFIQKINDSYNAMIERING